MKNSKEIKSKKMPKIALSVAIIIIAIIAITCIIKFKNASDFDMTPQLARTLSYDMVDKEKDKPVAETNGNVNFDAFFLTNINGIANPVRGTCNEVGSQGNLYMELSVNENGYIKDAVITMNGQNFYFNTSMVKDNELKNNYISSNTKTIEFNDITNGTQKLLIGSVRSGDYSNSNSKTSAIGNDTTKYSKEDNSVTFSGIYVDGEGNETPFTKTVPFTVDWYGETDCTITPKSQSTTISNMDSLTTEDELKLNFSVTTTESKNQLIMSEAGITGTIPEFNGYKATSVKITGTNVEYTYDEETGAFTAKREAIVDENGKVTSNAYSYMNYGTRYNTFNFTVTYPIEAYQELGEDVSSIELAIPVEATNKAFNNPNEEDGFQNPLTSNVDKGVVVTTWRKYVPPTGEIYSPSFGITVGTYMYKPYYDYVISKRKPINIYNGISLEETNDTYLVQWRAYSGTNGSFDGIMMKEATGQTDKVLDTSGTYTSMEEFTSNVGIYFSGATDTLGTDGWIKVYDEDTGALLETFTSRNWNSYSASSPYRYKNKVKHIRVETSATKPLTYFYVYNVKELDDEYITDNYVREEFDNLSYIYSYLNGQFKTYQKDESGEVIYKTDENGKVTTEPEVASRWEVRETYHRALYEAPTSIATIGIKESAISTQITAEHEKITITTDTSGYNEQLWKNGTFLVQLPEDIIFASINEVTVNNSNVRITAYDIYEENGNYYIKILTENEIESSYSITIDCDLTADPRVPRRTETVKLYATNEIACDYKYSGADIYDVDGDSNKTEQVNYATTSLTLDPGNSLNTSQTASNYDEDKNVMIAPRVAMADKDQRTATISISATNNYTYDVKEIAIVGVVPAEGNKYVLSGKDLESQYSTTMSEGGISTKTNEIKDKVTIYYSTNETPIYNANDAHNATNKDEYYTSNGWVKGENVEDWSKIKTYMIVVDPDYELLPGKTIDFDYEISIPQGIDYNKTTYSEHAIYFGLDTDDGLYLTATGCAKLGFMIAKQFNIEIVKYQEDTNKTLSGITFTLQEDGAETSTIKTTNQDGVITMSGLFAERYYTLKEQRTTEDYVLNSQEIRFYTYTEINEDGSESLYLAHVNDDGSYADLSDVYGFVKEVNVFPPDAEQQKDYKIQLKIENEPKVKLSILKTDAAGQPLKNVRFRLLNQEDLAAIRDMGKDINDADLEQYIGNLGKIYSTDKNGYINVSGLYLDQDYALREVRATGYYVPETAIKFRVTNDNGTFRFATYDDFAKYTKTTKHEITTIDELPTISLQLANEKIPTYGLQLTKYAKDEKITNDAGEEVDKVLPKAQYQIFGEGLPEDGKIFTTDENGVLTIDGLYEYVPGKYITGRYTLKEIYAPEGYALSNVVLEFRAYRLDDGSLEIEILDGEEMIRDIVDTYIDETTGEEQTDTWKDQAIDNADGAYPMIKIGVEDSQIFTLYKYAKNGTKEIPIPGTKFVITDLDGNYVTGSDGNIVGEWVDTTPPRIPTPDIEFNATTQSRKWTQNADGTWESTGNKGINSSTSYLTSYDFTLEQAATLKFEWAQSSEYNYDYVTYTITDVKNNKTFKTENLKGKNQTTFATVNVELPVGTYKIEFTYYKDGSSNSGNDLGYVKNIGFSEAEIPETGYYVVTTDENGQLTANLPEGLYKAVEVYVDDKYELDPTPHYFGIGASQAATWDWTNSVNGNGWNYMNGIAPTKNGGVIGVGSFSEYNIAPVTKDAEDGIDVNKDGIVDKVSLGNNDGIIISYDTDGKALWSKQFGGSGDDALNKVMQTSDGGYVAVGYVSSRNVQYDGTKIEELSKPETEENLANRDAVLLKLNSEGNYEWGVRFGGTSDDEALSVVETSDKQIVVVGKYYSSTFNIYETGSTDIKESFERKAYRDGFIVSFSEAGKYNWSQRIGGQTTTNMIDVSDVIECDTGIAVAINSYTGGIYLTTAATSSNSSNYTIVAGYNLNGTYSWYKNVNGTANDKVTSIDMAKNGDIIAGVCFSGTQYDARIYKIPKSGTNYGTGTSISTTPIYTLSGAYDEYVSDVTATSDGGILFGGWYYSTAGLDVDGDGDPTGKFDLPELSGEYTSDGYVIKLDADGAVQYASRLYGDGYDGVTSVAETRNGSLISAGYFNSAELRATNYVGEIDPDAEEGTTDELLLSTRKGNSEGFIVAEGASGAAVPEKQRLDIENKLKQFKVTTEVRKHDENGKQVAGGDIDGEVDFEKDGIKYSKDGWRFIETVDYGKDSLKTIEIRPDPNYVIVSITINDVEYTNFTLNEEGNVILPIFENMTEDKHIIVEFSNTLSTIEVNHYLWTEADGKTTNKVADSEYYTGDVGADYTTSPATDIEYELVTNSDYYDGSNMDTLLEKINVEQEKAGKTAYESLDAALIDLGYNDTNKEFEQNLEDFLNDTYIPRNYVGQYINGKKQIIDYYYREKTYNLTVHHYIEGTEIQVPLKGSTTEEGVPDEFTEGFKKNDPYTTTQAPEDKIDYNIYELVAEPENKEGTIIENTVVTYYYRIKTGDLPITKVAEEDHSVVLPDTEFAIYKLTGEKPATDELINPKNPAECWTLVKTYKTSSNGLIRIEDLPITEEYRLVETKAAPGRLVAEGQWKIEFIYGDYDETDSSIIQVNGKAVRVTAIGNPPALAITEDGKLQLPNREIFDLPTSGSFGVTTFYQIGLAIIAIGMVFLVMRKVVLVRGSQKSKTKKQSQTKSKH